VSVAADLAAKPTAGTQLTIFSHPAGRPLEWSKLCNLANPGATQFQYQCDTQGGSSGAAVIRTDTLKVVGLHFGGGGNFNGATFLLSTPLASFVGGANPPSSPVTGARVVNTHSNKCLDVANSGTTNGTNIQLFGCNGSSAQSFDLKVAGTGAFNLVNTSSGKCVDVTGSGSNDGTNIELFTCNGTGAQAFAQHDVGGGVFELVNVQSGKCVDVTNSGTADGTNVQLFSCNGSDAQHWRLQ
jgi:hypothetical protein